jgi:hypothetical protein
MQPSKIKNTLNSSRRIDIYIDRFNDFPAEGVSYCDNFSVIDRFCGLVVSVPVYRSKGPGSIPGATRFSEK